MVLIDRRAEPGDRIGESLPAAARPLLADLGLWEAFLADGHGRCHARRSAWGAPEPVELDALADPHGAGWRLDRRRFEQRLRDAAQARGAALIAPARAASATRRDGGWTVAIAAPAQPVRARVVIDAGGRGSRLLRQVAGRRIADDRLVCAWTHAPLRRPAAGLTYVESERGGWWYTAPLPCGRRLLAFHTDSDLEDGGAAMAALAERARRLPELAATIADADFASAAPARLCAAHGSRLAAAAGEGWLAAGDAAMSFDPLSSQGLFHALYTGVKAAEAADRMLDGAAGAGTAYAAALEPVWEAYRRHRAYYYGIERRWAGAPFWRRRHAADAASGRLARVAVPG